MEVAKIETAPSLQFLGRNLHVIELCINAESLRPLYLLATRFYDALSTETDGINFDEIEKLGEFEQRTLVNHSMDLSRRVVSPMQNSI